MHLKRLSDGLSLRTLFRYAFCIKIVNILSDVLADCRFRPLSTKGSGLRTLAKVK